jgi:hypothetical protein
METCVERVDLAIEIVDRIRTMRLKGHRIGHVFLRDLCEYLGHGRLEHTVVAVGVERADPRNLDEIDCALGGTWVPGECDGAWVHGVNPPELAVPTNHGPHALEQIGDVRVCDLGDEVFGLLALHDSLLLIFTQGNLD